MTLNVMSAVEWLYWYAYCIWCCLIIIIIRRHCNLAFVVVEHSYCVFLSFVAC